MPHYPLRKTKCERTCELCLIVFMTVSRPKKFCPPCREKMDFLRHRVPTHYGGVLRAEDARMFLLKNPHWEIPQVRKRSYELKFN